MVHWQIGIFLLLLGCIRPPQSQSGLITGAGFQIATSHVWLIADLTLHLLSCLTTGPLVLAKRRWPRVARGGQGWPSTVLFPKISTWVARGFQE